MLKHVCVVDTLEVGTAWGGWYTGDAFVQIRGGNLEVSGYYYMTLAAGGTKLECFDIRCECLSEEGATGINVWNRGVTEWKIRIDYCNWGVRPCGREYPAARVGQVGCWDVTSVEGQRE